MKSATALAVGLALLATAADAWSQSEPVQLRGRRWRPELSGTLRSDNNSVTGTRMDTRGTLDLTDEPDLDDIGAIFHFPGMGRVNFQQWEGKFESQGVTLDEDVNFSGATFTAGTAINSSIDWRVASMMMEYDPAVVPIGNIPALVSMDAGVKYIRFQSDLNSGSQAASCSVKGYMPVIGFHARMQPLSILTFEADVNTLLVDVIQLEGLKGTITDAALAAQVTYSSFYAGAGYRWLKMKIQDKASDVDNIEARLLLKGFFVEIGFKF